MLKSVNIESFADNMLQSNIVASNLLKIGYEDAASVAIKRQKFYDPEKFEKLLKDGHFNAAQAWLSYDPDESQASIVSNIDFIFDNMFVPDLIIMALYIIKKLRKRNRSFEMAQRFKSIAKKFYDSLPCCKNPMLVAVLFAELTSGRLRRIFLETALRIENSLSENCGSTHSMEIYYDKDRQGRWLISIIRDMNALDLIETEGVK